MQIICSRTQRLATADNTRLLLHSSTISRRLPQKLTRNLHKCRKDWSSSTYGRPAAPYEPTGKSVRAKLKTLQKSKHELAWDLVGEIIQMAEVANNSRWVVIFSVNAGSIAILSELVPSVDLGNTYAYVANDAEGPVLIQIFTGT